MIQRLLNRLGYTHKSQMDLNFYLNGVSTVIGDPTDYTLTKEIEEQFFKDLSAVDNINSFLDATLAADMQREFSAQEDMQRHLIKGAFGRTSYFKMGVKKANNL